MKNATLYILFFLNILYVQNIMCNFAPWIGKSCKLLDKGKLTAFPHFILSALLKNMSAMEEVWKEIPFADSGFLVSNYGRVKTNVLYGKVRSDFTITKQQRNNSGYMQVRIRVGGKSTSFLVHRLVAMAFLPNPNNLPCINHKDENKLNNFVGNLEWCTHKYNINYGTCIERARIKNINNPKTSYPVAQYTLEGILIAVYPSVREVKRQCEFKSFKGIYECCEGNAKSACGYMWRYIHGDILLQIPSIDTIRKRCTAKKKVYKYSLNNDEIIGEYPSISEAARKHNIKNSNICACCKGEQKSAGGFRWSYDKLS